MVDGVADAVGVEVGTRHGVGFFVDQAVLVAVDGGIDAEGEDVLVVCGEDSWVHDGAPWYLDPVVDGLCAYDTRRSHLVLDLSGLIEDEGHDVLVVGNCDDRLDYELSVTDDGSFTGPIIRVLPANAGILLVDTYYIFHGPRLTLFGVEHGVEVVDGSQAIAAKLEIIGHDTCSSISQVEGGFLMKRMSRVSIGDDHV